MSIGDPTPSSRRPLAAPSRFSSAGAIPEESPPPSRRPSMSADDSVSGFPFSAPGFRPLSFTEIPRYMPPIPSFKEASTAVVESRRGFETMGDPVSAHEYSDNVTNLGETVSTVRAWLNSTVANDPTLGGLERLSTAFNDAKTDPSQLDALFHELESAAIHIGNRPGINTEEGSPYQRAGEIFAEAKSATLPEFRCQLGVESTRLLMQAYNDELDQIEAHMQMAESNQAHMAANIDPGNLPVTSFAQTEAETVLRPLEFVLNYNGEGTHKPEKFDIDGFVQLLYKNQALGSTISSAASRYSVSGSEMRDFVGNIPDIDTRQTAHEVALEMFGSRDHIDLGSYLREILSRTPEPRRQTAYEAFCEAMKHMRPITRGDADIHGTP